MARFVAACVCVVAIGCGFDESFLEDVSVPAQVVLRNASEQSLRIDAVYGAPDADAAFSLNAQALDRGREVALRVPEATFDALTSRRFRIDAECADGTKWSRDGRDASIETTREPDALAVTISVTRCAE